MFFCVESEYVVQYNKFLHSNSKHWQNEPYKTSENNIYIYIYPYPLISYLPFGRSQMNIEIAVTFLVVTCLAFVFELGAMKSF